MTRSSTSEYRHPVRRAGLILAACAGLTFASAAAALAESACVLCSGPDAAYECNAYANEPIAETALALFCTSRLASDYGHSSCAVERTTSRCTGLPVHFPYEPLEGTLLSPAAPEGDKEISGEPQTLGELAGETIEASKRTVKQTGQALGDAAESTGKAIKDAGESISGAARKTWTCLGSALSDC